MDRVLARLVVTLGLALIVMGLALGFVPSWGGESGQFGGVVDCGSPFRVDTGGLTDFGVGSCEAEGLSERRAWAIAFLLGGVVVLFGAGQLTKPTFTMPTRREEPEEFPQVPT